MSRVLDTPGFVSIPRPSLHDAVQTQLRRFIVMRGLQPGDRLPTEAELVEALGTSRVVIREALRSMEALGIVEVRAGSGRYLSETDWSAVANTLALSLALYPNALSELLTVRTAMEVETIRTLGNQVSMEALDQLDRLVERMRSRVAVGDTNTSEEDAAFHQTLLAATGSRLATALVDLYWRAMLALYAAGFPGPDIAAIGPVVEAHGEIVDALRRKDADTAAVILRRHHEEARLRFIAWRAAQTASPGSEDAVQRTVRGALMSISDTPTAAC